MVSNEKYRLSDNAIAHFVQLFQLGLLTGTDIADQFRTFVLTVEDGMLQPDPEYIETFEQNLSKLQSELEEKLAADAKNAPGFKGMN